MKLLTLTLAAFLLLLSFTSISARELALLDRLNTDTPSATGLKMQLQDRVNNIKDETKQKIVEKLSERLSMMNENWTHHWSNVLERLNLILDKIETRVEKLGGQGKDTTAVMQQINYAQTAINTAQTAVDAQAEKDYAFEISSETNVRSEVQATITQFKKDARMVLEKIKSARENVRLALVQMGQLTGERVEVQKEAE